MLMTLHVIQSPIHWLTDAFWGKITIIIAITWRWTGYNMIFFLSALQNIDPEIYEAAEIDGANVVQKFFSITAPLLKPIILFTSITSISGTLQLFDEVVNFNPGEDRATRRLRCHSTSTISALNTRPTSDTHPRFPMRFS